MGNLLNHARHELSLIGEADDEMQAAMNNNLLKMVETFEDEGHSGFSASYAISALKKLLNFEPLKPLTGEDGEWNSLGDGSFQNKRCPRVFKDETGAYDIQGRVFVEPDGGAFTSRDSRVYVTFPYHPTTEYVNVNTSKGGPVNVD